MSRGTAFQTLTGLLGRFRVIITLVVIAALVLTAGAFMTFTGREVNRSTLAQGDAEARNILRVIMLNLANQKSGLDYFKNYARQRYEQQLRDLVSVVVSQIDYFHGLHEKGILSEEQAKTAALEAIQKHRYGNNDYFFVYDRRNIAISHPDPKIRGRDMSSFEYVKGQPLAKSMWEMTKERQDGFLTIWWTRLGEKKPVPKLLYFHHYSRWDWMIGTGIYIDDIDRDVEKKMAEIVTVLKQTFNQVRVAETGYFSLFEGTGKILIHPYLADTDANILRDAVTGKNHLHNLIAASANPAVPLKYYWDKPATPGDYSYLKYSHVEHFTPFDWYVSSSVYQDEMERPAAKILHRQTIFVFLILLFSLTGVYFLVARLTSPLARLARHAALLQESDFSLPEAERSDLSAITFPHEAAHLALTFREMEERLDDYLKYIGETTAAREKMESELRIARDIQMSMLPDQAAFLRGHPEIELSAFLEAAREVGGDLYDFFMVDPDRLCFLIGDVSDKGVPAALFMARSKAILRIAAARPGAMPDVILAEANRELLEGNTLMMFITVSLGILDLRSGELVLSNAGHVPPLFMTRNGLAEWIEPPTGKPLGITGRASFSTLRRHLKPGDCLLVFTDGVTEAQNSDACFYGDDRLLECLRLTGASDTAESLTSAVLRDVRSFAGDAPQYDDIAILCIRYCGLQRFTGTLEITDTGSEERIVMLLDEAEAFLNTVGVNDDVTFDIRVALDELLTNLLQHALRQEVGIVTACLELTMEDEKINVVVADSGPPFDLLQSLEIQPERTKGERKIGGLGLHLVRSLMDQISYKRENDENVLLMMKKTG